MDHLKAQFDRGKKRAENREYRRLSFQIQQLRRKEDNLPDGAIPERQALRQARKRQMEQRWKVPASDQMDANYRRLYYCRYADDFVIGIIGAHADAEAVMHDVQGFIRNMLKLNTSDEKTKLVNARQGTTFLGYQLAVRSAARRVKVRRGTRHTVARSFRERSTLRISAGRLRSFGTRKGYGDYASFDPAPRMGLTSLSEAEIVTFYNGELRGLANYYALAKNVKGEMNKLHGLWQGSLIKTLAAKRRSRVSQVYRSLRQPNGRYALTVPAKGGGTWQLPVFNLQDVAAPDNLRRAVDNLPTLAWLFARTELITRLTANRCEYCATTAGSFEVHHIGGLKTIKQGKALWQRIMKERNRKTLILCVSCHRQLHAGTLPSTLQTTTSVDGEPSTVKAVSSVRRGADA